MIVLTTVKNIGKKDFSPGDTFILTVTTEYSDDRMVITKHITEDTVIDTVVLYRFATDDGTCVSPNLASIYGSEGKFPKEIECAVSFGKLTMKQKENFFCSLTRSVKRY